MNCSRVHERLTDLHDGLCTAPEAEAVRLHLAGCADCRAHQAELNEILDTLAALPAEEPSPRLRENFQRMLAEEKAAEREASLEHSRAAARRSHGRVIAFPVWTQFAAAACLMLVGGLAGATLFPRQAPVSGDPVATSRQLAEMQGKLDSMSQLVAFSLSRQQPDNARLQRVAAQVDGKTAPSSAQLAALVGTLAFDASTNVRLSALEALYPHAEQAIVREGVIASLPRERAPLVQLAMIDFLSSLRDTQANKAIEALIHDTTTDERVREAARRALAVSL
jgi:hypothetical protein